jgi:hypothetical protein
MFLMGRVGDVSGVYNWGLGGMSARTNLVGRFGDVSRRDSWGFGRMHLIERKLAMFLVEVTQDS